MSFETAEIEPQLPTSLQRIGFTFDPFEHPEASSDPHLASYLVDHPCTGLVRDNLPAVLFAPPGGGKTALRISAVNDIWTGYGLQHTFPVPFLLPTRMSPAQQRIHIGHTAARVLLIALAAQPELLVSITSDGKQQIVNLLAATLSRPLSHYIRLFAAQPSLSTIVRQLDFRYQLPPRTIPPDLEVIAKLLTNYAAKPLNQGDTFAAMQHVLLDVFEFPSIILYLDGVDGDATETPDVHAMWQNVAWAIEQAQTWQQQHIILKAFLPDELAPYLRTTDLRQYTVVWTPALLADVLRSRIYQATGGAYGSFDALASRDVRDIEMWLATEVPPLPREIIVLAQLVLRTYQRSTDRMEAPLTSSIIEQAITDYNQEQPLRFSHPSPGAPLLSGVMP